MKHERLLTLFTSTVLAFVISLGSVGCMVTGLDLNLENPHLLVLACLLSSLFCAVALAWKKGGLLIACAAALAAGYLWHRGILLHQLLGLIHRISYVYDSAYHWGYLPLTEEAWNAGLADWPMAVTGCLIALTVNYTVSRGRGTPLAVAAALVPLAFCLVVTDTVPSEGYLFVLMVGLTILVFPCAIRLESLHQANQLAAMVSLPVLVAATLLFLAVPKEGYVNQAKDIQETIIAWATDFPQMLESTVVELSADLQGGQQQNVELKNLGTRAESSFPVMEVTATVDGPLYLRGQDYDVYDGTRWQASPDRTEILSMEYGEPDTVTIRTRSRKNLLYLPYYPIGETQLTGGYLENAAEIQEYTLDRRYLPEGWEALYRDTASMELPEALQEQYTQLPEATREKGEALLYGTLPTDSSNTQIAQIIGEMVRNSARYDLRTGKMPQDEVDFALWFLSGSNTGYCVHFATAAAVLLRAADVPARYVTGYLVDAAAGETVTVTGGNAHAWVEYYEPELRTWLILEATPAEETEETTPATISVDTEPTVQPLPPEQAQPSAPETQPESTQPTMAPVPASQDTGGGIWKYLLLVCFLGAAVIGQRFLRLRLRRNTQLQGDNNRRALAKWQEAERLYRLLKEAPAQELDTLAQKAKFSQHTLTDGELAQFDACMDDLRQRLREKPWYTRLVHQYIFAAY